ncbi:unnamed protein product [Angiostrongylus costaricensis]|uniref:RING-type domain-containing protein n=1 Tax=Angiostrongylus costaricensis TaxID=334426 RepID=A0A0R3PIX1_ANGCS|nr:unnamed protein product [Angiostrongylus costaricensis]
MDNRDESVVRVHHDAIGGEEWQIEHAKLHEKHRGHEQMHLEMMLILVVTLVVAQVFLVQWKKRHFKSYQLCTLLGMWLIPVYVCITRSWYRFLMTWLVYTICSTWIWRKSTEDHIHGSTPRLVYKWFLFLHKLSYVLGIAGYIVMVFTLMGLNHIFGLHSTSCMDAGILLLFYGLYYGVLGRDFAHICTDRMACKIGSGVCAICDNRLVASNFDDKEEEEVEEKTYSFTIVHCETSFSPNHRVSYVFTLFSLSCGHVFHEFCIRGWVVVGKLQTCPYCKEKVDLKRMFKNP